MKQTLTSILLTVLLGAILIPLTASGQQKVQKHPIRQDAQCSSCVSFEIISMLVMTEEMNYMWSFGDHQSAFGQSIKHCYDKPGVYYASLTVMDKEAQTPNQKIPIRVEITPDYIYDTVNTKPVITLLKVSETLTIANPFTKKWDINQYLLQNNQMQGVVIQLKPSGRITAYNDQTYLRQ